MALVALACAAPAAATTYYVSSSGSDTRSGTSPAEAWATLDRANRQDLDPGDQLLFEGGRTFSGTVSLDRLDGGTPSAPIVISSYGSGRATIAAGVKEAILAYNSVGYRISNLALVGAGRDSSTSSGILFYADLGGDVLLDTVQIDNVTASKFGRYGIEVGSWNNRTGYRNVRITGITATENGLGGIFTYAQVRAVHRNVYVGYSLAAFNSGFYGLAYNSGNGITLSGVDGGTIEHSVAHDNGWRSDAGNGPVGIWTFASNNVVIQHCESHHNLTGGAKDGGGFHLDNSTSNSVLQYNYSHDNAGAGYMLAHRDNDFVHSGNVVRWNVSQNDARTYDYAALHLWGRIRNAQIYNNTIYMTGGNPQSRVLHARNNTIEAQDLEHVRVSNNLFISTGGQPVVDFIVTTLDGSTGVRLEGNAYWSSGSAFRIMWKGTTYTSLAHFRAATGQERLNGGDVGRSAEPDLAAAGAGPTFNDPAMLKGLWQYRFKATSQLVDAGIDLAELGIDIGSRDFFGGTARKLASDIGAHELDEECSWSLTPASGAAGAAGGSGSIGVWAAADSCGWAVQAQAAWISASPTSGSGQGTVAYTVAANGGAERTGTITIGNQTFVITQAGSGTPPPPPPPSGGAIGNWSHGDVGATGVAGGSSLSGSTYSLRGGGADIWGTADAFHYLRQPVSGDWEIEARVATVENVHAWTKAGLMIRETLDAGSKHAAIYVTPGKGISFQYRASTGGTSGAGTGLAGTAPQTLRLSRQGSTLTAFLRRADGTWITVGSATIAMGSTVQIGLVIGSHDATRAATATFDGVTLRSLSTPPPPPPPPPPPDTTWQHSDVGAVGIAGNASGDAASFTVEGSGADIWNTADAFHFVHRQVSGDWDVDATVSSVEAVHAWTKAGVMIRETLAAGSTHAAIYVTPGKGISLQYRGTTGGTSGAGVGVTGSAPKRVRISRRGSTLTGYLQNADGGWTQVGSASIAMGASVYVGLAVGSHDNTQLATASFTNVVLTQP